MSLLVIVADSLRADVAGCCGGPANTPTLDRLAAEGLFVPRAVSAAPWTVPSVAAMLSGVYPHRLGLAKWEQPWPAGHPTLFERAEQAGLEVASFVFDPRYFFSSVPAARVAGSSQDTAAVLGRLRADRERPGFAFLHYWWTHVPYVAKPMTTAGWRRLADEVLAAVRAGGTAREGVRRLYRHAVERFSEDWLRRVLDAVDLDRTWVVVLADHGESWGERRGAESVRDVFDLHGQELFEEVLRVPLWIRPPGGGSARRMKGLVRTVDLLPTLLELCELGPAPDGIDGVSLADGFRDGRASPVADALAVRNADFLRAPKLPEDPHELWNAFALLTGRRKLIWEPATGGRLAFDLQEDPGETVDVAARDATVLDSGWRRLEAERARAVVGPLTAADLARTAERLRQLGYLE